MAVNKQNDRCPVCKGSRVVVCPICNGSGKLKDSACHVCNGTGLVRCRYCLGWARVISEGDFEVEVHGADAKDVATVASAILEKAAKHSSVCRHGSLGSGSFYLFSFAVVIAIWLAVAELISVVAIPVVLFAGILALSIMGAFQLRRDKKLSQKNFIALMALALKTCQGSRVRSNKERATLRQHLTIIVDI